MNPLPSILGPEGDLALRRLFEGPALIAFDFDGTLAPIVEHPPDARMQPSVEAQMRRLATLVPLAIVSGRGLDDLRERAPVGVHRLIGNHGNDGVLADPVAAAQARSVCRGWIDQAEVSIAQRFGQQRFGQDSGIEIEDKGLTLSVHYRRARDPTDAAEWLRKIAAALTPAPRIIGGKMLVNLLPPGAGTKFEALQRLAGELATDRVLFVGDDDTDEIVFERAPSAWLTVRVEPGRQTAARFSLTAQDEVAWLIERLLERLDPAGVGDGLRSS